MKNQAFLKHNASSADFGLKHVHSFYRLVIPGKFKAIFVG